MGVNRVRSIALLLLTVGVIGLVRGLCTSAAQRLYYVSKFGACRDDMACIARNCATAAQLYGVNYYFFLWAAERAYDASLGGGEDAARMGRLARRWCDRGVALNPYNSSLRLLRTRLLQEEDPAAAAAYWQRYVDWNPWHAHHHAVLTELYADAGQWRRALLALRFIRGRPYHAEARRALRAALEREKTSPPDLSTLDIERALP